MEFRSLIRMEFRSLIRMSAVNAEMLHCSTIDLSQKLVRRSQRLCSLVTHIFSDLHNMKYVGFALVKTCHFSNIVCISYYVVYFAFVNVFVWLGAYWLWHCIHQVSWTTLAFLMFYAF